MNNKTSATTKKYQQFIIGGTIKAATSSLYNYIAAHPQVCGSRVKETYFFSQGFSGDTDADFKRYADFFSPQPENTVLMEASPNYLAYKENVAPRIHQLFPDMKILFILRNPADRLYSHYNFAKGKLQLPQDMDFETFIDLCGQFGKGEITPEQAGMPETHLRALEIGNYGPYLQQFYDVFDRNNIKVMFFEDLNTDPIGKLEEISGFIGVEPAFYKDYIMNKSNVTFSARMKFLHMIVLLLNRMLEPILRHSPALKHRLVKIYKFFNRSRQEFVPMQQQTRGKLVDYYTPSNAELRKILNGQSLPSWLD